MLREKKRYHGNAAVYWNCGVEKKPMVLTCTCVQVTCDRYGIDRYRCGVMKSHLQCDPCYTLSFSISFFPYTNPPPFFSLATGAHHQHCSPQTGGKKSLNKQSYQCCERLFNAPVPNDNLDAVSHALPTEASRDHWTEEEIDAVLPWVS